MCISLLNSNVNWVLFYSSRHHHILGCMEKKNQFIIIMYCFYFKTVCSEWFQDILQLFIKHSRLYKKKKVFMDIIFILIIKHATVVEIEYKLICIQPVCFQLRSLHQCLKKKYTYQLLPEQQESFFVQSSVVQPFRLLFSKSNEGPRTKQ